MVDSREKLAILQKYRIRVALSEKRVSLKEIECDKLAFPRAKGEAHPIALTMNESLASQPPCSLEPTLMQANSAQLMQHQADYTSLKQQITQFILTSTNPEAALQQIVNLLGEVFQVDSCLITTSTSSQASSEATYWSANAEVTLAESHIALLRHWVSQATLTGLEPLAIADLEQANSLTSHSSPEIQTLSETTSMLSLQNMFPIRAVLGKVTRFQGDVNGVISLMRSQPYDWTETEMTALQTLSDQVAIAIAQVQIQRQLRQQAQHQTLIDQLTLAVHRSGSLHQILRLATEGIAQALQVDQSMVLLLRYSDPLFKNLSRTQIPKVRVTVMSEWPPSCEPAESLESDIASDSETSKRPSPSFWMSECGLCQQVFAHSPQPLVVSDRHEFPTIDPAIGVAPIFNPEEMPACLLAPLESQGTVLGFLLLQHHQPRSWQPEELKLVELVGAHVSTAIIQTQTLRQVQALVEERTAQLQRSLDVQAKLYEKTRQQIDQLRQLNQLKDEFLSTMSHELRTPLTSMTLAIRMLRQPELPPERRAKYLDILEEQCNQETTLINDLLTLQQLESKQVSVHLQKINLNRMIEDLVPAFEQKWADRGLSLVVDLPKRSLMLQSDADSLSRILFEILTNAGKYSEPGTTVHLSANQQVDPETHLDQVVLSFSNTGPGISPTELPYIFDKFRRGEGVTQQAIQGVGLGLALVKSLVQHLNGAIAVVSCPSEQTESCKTRFTITLPQVFDNTKP